MPGCEVFNMSFVTLSEMPLRNARLKLSLITLALAAVALLLPARALASCSTAGSVTTCTSSGGITVSGTVGASQGSAITVGSLPGTVSDISIKLTGLDVTGSNGGGLNSVAIALVAPSGAALDLASGICNEASSTFTFADSGDTGTNNENGMLPALGEGTCTGLSGTYFPSDFYPGLDTFTSPGPSTYDSGGNTDDGTGSFNFSSAFGLPASATSMQGTWTLYIATQVGGQYTPGGSLGSWSIALTTESATATTTSVSANPNGLSSNVFTSANGAATSVTLTATISPSPSSGTVTFYDSTGTTAGLGTVLASGVAVSGSQAQKVVTFPAAEEGSRSISAVFSGTSSYASSTSSTATVLTVNHPSNPSGTTYCNGPVNQSDNPSNVGGTGGYPYPSQLILSGISGTIESVTVTLNGLQVQDPDFTGFMLQAPNGNGYEFMAWADGNGPGGSPASLTSTTVWLADGGSGLLQTNSQGNNAQESCTSGSPCKPADDYVQIDPLFDDTFPAAGTPFTAPTSVGKAAPTGSATFASEFGGAAANGTWLLYLNNWLSENPSNNGSIPYGQVGSWCLNLTMQLGADATTTTVSSLPNPISITSGTTASATFTATVKDSSNSNTTVNAGTVTFVDGATTLGSSSVSNGTASVTASLTEGTHQVVASYSGTNTGSPEFGISNGTVDLRVNKATTASGSGAGPYSFCNSGSIIAPATGYDYGAGLPYPSNIFVTNLPGTVKATTVTLNDFTTRDQGDLMSLLVGPGGNNLDFFSLTGSNVGTAPTGFNLTFQDGGSAIGGTNLTGGGPYEPSSENGNPKSAVKYPQCAQNATLCGTQNVGPPLGASSTFTPSNEATTAGGAIFGDAGASGVFGGGTSSIYNGNGTWSLYIDDGGTTGEGEDTSITGGWCVNLTVNQPTVSVDAAPSSSITQGQQGVQLPVAITSEGPGSTGDPSGTSPMTVSYVLSAAFTYAGTYSGSGWTCNSSSQTVTCTNDSAVADGSGYNTLGINVNVSPSASFVGNVNNSITVSGAGVASSGAVSYPFTIVPAPVLSVSKTHTGTFTQGQTAQWNIAVSNSAGSTSITSGTTTVSDTLPSGYTVNNFGSTSGTWSCGGTNTQTATCTATAGISGGNAFPTIQVFVNVPAASPTSVTNTALAYGGGDLTHTNSGNAATGLDSNVTVVQVPASISATGGTPQSTAVNTAFGTSLSATVKDAGGVVVNNATVTFTAPGSGVSGTFGNSTNTITGSTNSSGVLSETFTANTSVGAYNITASVAGVATPATFALTNNPGAATHFTVSGPGITTAGFSFSLSVTALDAFGNTATGYTGTVHFTSTDAGTGTALPGNFTFTSGNAGTATFPVTLVTAGTQSVTATDVGNSSITGTASILVNPAAATHLLIPGGPEPFNTTFGFNIYAYDAFGNLATSYNGTVAFTSSDPGFVNLGPVTLSSGVGSQSGVLKTAGTDSITATDTTNSSITGTGFFTIQPGVATFMGLVAPSSTYAGSPISYTLTAYDLYGNVATSYGGTVVFTSTDPSAILPGSTAITNGTGTFQATLETAGNQTITATDAANSLAATTGNISVTIPALVVTTANDDAGLATNCTVQTTPGTGTDPSCSLRDALLESASLGSASITFDSTAFASTNSALANTISLTNGTLSIPTNTTITGPTSGSGYTLANLVTVAGGGSSSDFPVFTVNSSALNAAISGLAITNGNSSTNAGAIVNGYQAALTVIDSTISGNTAATGTGGIFNDYNATLNVIDSTISGNSGAVGGIVEESGGTVTVKSSSITGNTGSGISNIGANVTVTDSTISGNASTFSGGGINNGSGSLTLANTIVAGNTATANPDINGTYTDTGGNLIPGVNGVSLGSINLAPQANYGGPTQTLLPLPGSSAICGGVAIFATSAGITADQRAFEFDPNCPAGTVDSGAVQTNYALAFTQNFQSSYFEDVAITPSVPVALTESGAAATAATNSVTMADGEAVLTGTTSVALSGGQADFTNLIFPEVESTDTLIASLSLNPALTPPLNLNTAPSPPFQVSAGIATLTSPNAGSTIGTGQTFTWTTGTGVTAYWFNLGYGPYGAEAKEAYDSGPIHTTSVTVNGIGSNGVTVYATLYSLINSVWLSQSYTFTESGSPVPAALTAPTTGSILTGTSANFTWNTGAGVTAYWLNVGTGTTAAAMQNVYSSGQTLATTASVTGIPALAQPFYATLYSLINGVWQPTSYTFTESGTPVAATLTLPTSGTQLNGSATFTWSPGQLITYYWLTVGDGPGNAAAKDLYSSGPTTSTTASVSGLPTFGGTLYVTLYSYIYGTWQPTVYTFLETGTAQPATLTFPGSGATLDPTSQTFNWTAGSGVTSYWLDLGYGTNGVSAKNIYSSGAINATTATVTGLPAFGVPIYATLYSYINGVWEPMVYTFNSSGSPVAATMISPTSPSTLPSGSETFTWTTGGGVTAYWLNLGTSPTGANSKNIYDSESMANTSATVTGLPSNGETIYATLYSLINGVWQSVQYTYTAF